MSGDVVGREKAALEGITEEPWVAFNDGTTCGVIALNVKVATGMRAEDAGFTAAARSLVPELVAEVERDRRIKAEMQRRDDSATGVISRQKDDLERLRAEVERLRARETKLREIAEKHVDAPCDCNAIAHQLLAVLDGEARS